MILLVLLALIFYSCGNKQEGDSQADLKSDSVISEVSALDGTPFSIAGVTFRPSGAWKDLGPSGMRKAEYTFGPEGEDADSATLTTYYFGPTGGGGVRANLDRWIGQMSPADQEAQANESQMTVDGMTAHFVEVDGIYNASMGGPMSGSTVPKEGYFMSAVVLEAPEGNLFFKLTGPKHTAEIMSATFRKMIQEIKRTDETQ
jgi:hypothetical protein